MNWIKAAELDALSSDYAFPCRVAGQHVALYLVAGDVKATSNICTHKFAILSEGDFDGQAIECPVHQARFDVSTGAVLCGPTEVPLRTFPVELRGNEVWVSVEDAEAK